jgi:ubiquitin C-terminal hydrolase
MTLIDALHQDTNVPISKVPLPNHYSPVNGDDGVNLPLAANMAWHDTLSTDNSLVYSLFRGQCIQTTQCVECGRTSSIFDAFIQLTVGLGGNNRTQNALNDSMNVANTIPLLLQRHFGYEEMSAHAVGFECDSDVCKGALLNGAKSTSWSTSILTLDYKFQCGYPSGLFHHFVSLAVDAQKRTRIWRAPPILMIHLKRFTYDMRKNRVPIQYDDVLDVNPFVHEMSPQHGRVVPYRLKAVIVRNLKNKKLKYFCKIVIVNFSSYISGSSWCVFEQRS